MCEKQKRKVIVVGGGLVGSLCACFMAKRGYAVSMYERRDDIRHCKNVQGRSINLALSHRGRKALRTVGLEFDILKTAIPMKGRILHNPDGQTKAIPYDTVTNECIYSVDRNLLNRKLLQAAENYPNVKLHFNHKLVRSNFKEESITLLNTETFQSFEDKADLIVGADGAFSSLRRSMQQIPLFEFSQTYIEHGYLELIIPSTRGDQLTSKHLHIWPRGEFMMIALPNQDQSWTVTLFMPFERFKKIDNNEKVVKFFRETFPDYVTLIGERELIEIYFKNKPSTLVSVKCRPYHAGSNFVIIGDAAHAMVPFYGQGMNAGFEDCSILNQLLDDHNENIKVVIEEFSRIRVKSGHAVGQLAMYNYLEMRDLVTRPTYHLRKTLDNVLFKMFPEKWIPLYNSISFSHMEYSMCIQNKDWQDSAIKKIMVSMGFCLLSVIICFIYW